MSGAADTAAAGGEGPAEVLGEQAAEAIEPEALDEGAEGLDSGEEAVEEAEPERYTIKVNGEEREVSLDDLRTMAQKGAGAERKFEEAAKLRKELEGEIAAIRQKLHGDPVLRAYLSGGREALYQAMLEDLEYDALPEEERAERDRRRELEEKAKRADEYETRERERQEAEAAAQLQGRILDQMGAALEQVGIGKKPAAIRRLSYLAEAAIEEGAQVTMQQLAEQVRDEMNGDLTAQIPDDPEALFALLGEERVKALYQRETERLRSRSAAVKRTNGSRPRAERQSSGPRVVSSDFWKDPLG